MTTRNDWTFPYSVRDLLAATEATFAHHQERIAHWLKQVEIAETDLTENGIDFRKAVSPGMSTQYVAQPQFDTGKLATLREAQERVTRHQKECEDYGIWISIFRDSDPARMLDCGFSDVLYFGIAADEEIHP